MCLIVLRIAALVAITLTLLNLLSAKQEAQHIGTSSKRGKMGSE